MRLALLLVLALCSSQGSPLRSLDAKTEARCVLDFGVIHDARSVEDAHPGPCDSDAIELARALGKRELRIRALESSNHYMEERISALERRAEAPALEPQPVPWFDAGVLHQGFYTWPVGCVGGGCPAKDGG